ncbi:MAG: alpha-ketoacid dehydrogenase subunit beta [Alphaproteobacteria bacterium]|nr:alpha-ketoacid dehydrogenase subunit beta [Alphaproteobacteria bacterium]
MYLHNNNKSLTYAAALREAIVHEMKRDPSVFSMGQNVDDPKGMFGTTKDLHKIFGDDRNIDTPLAEDGMTGVAIGAALAGMRPIHVHQRMDFMLLAMNQIINMAAKSHYMYGGAVSIPLVIRGIIGRSWGQGPQHSQALHSFFMHIPGLKVFAPTTPHDAKGCMITAIRDNNPVIFIEHRMLHGIEGIVPEGEYEIPFGKARILSKGDDITIVAISHMVVEAIRAKNHLKEIGITAEIIDPVSLAPLDIQTISDSVRKTKNLLVVDNGWTSCGASAEIITQVIENLNGQEGVRYARMGFAPVTCPTTKPLENLFYPTSITIAEKASALVNKTSVDWNVNSQEAAEILEFRGPF